MTARTHQIIGVTIIAFSIITFFWWGIHFQVFGTKIRPTLADFGFFGWLLLGFFGAGFASGGWISGLKGAFGLLAAFAIAFGIGFLSGNYR
jgi:hypothetical protein